MPDSVSPPHSAETTTPPPSIYALAATFTRLSVCSIGGGNSGWMQRELVTKKRWMSSNDFLTGFAMCQVLPGATTINTAVFCGTKLRGWAGALATGGGMVAAPSFIVIMLGLAYASWGQAPVVAKILTGVSAAAIGITLRMGVVSIHRRFSKFSDWWLTAAIIIAVFWLRWSIVDTLIVFLPLSVAIAWWHYRPKPGERLP